MKLVFWKKRWLNWWGRSRLTSSTLCYWFELRIFFFLICEKKFIQALKSAITSSKAQGGTSSNQIWDSQLWAEFANLSAALLQILALQYNWDLIIFVKMLSNHIKKLAKLFSNIYNLYIIFVKMLLKNLNNNFYILNNTF